MMSERVRLAFTIGYIGRHYHGSQIQPDVKTVQGELIRVFHKLKWLNQDDESHNLVLYPVGRCGGMGAMVEW